MPMQATQTDLFTPPAAFAALAGKLCVRPVLPLNLLLLISP